MRTRGTALGMNVEVGDILSVDFSKDYCGAIVQYPDTYGGVHDWSQVIQVAHQNSVLMVACTDLMASVVLKPAGDLGFDIAVGSAQRFGVPMVRSISEGNIVSFSMRSLFTYFHHIYRVLVVLMLDF